MSELGDAVLLCLALIVAIGLVLNWVRKPNQHEGRVEKADNPVHIVRQWVDITDLEEGEKEYIQGEIEWMKGGRKGEITKKTR